ncbi:MAG TPA: hypothetical protein VE287_04805, partial [Actinopolymorphaceae bacterium]|nr:hypothetical protein [Actinopolymorphaceae bacterium]
MSDPGQRLDQIVMKIPRNTGNYEDAVIHLLGDITKAKGGSMRLRPLATALVACGVVVAALGGVSYATGLLPFARHAAPTGAAPTATTRVLRPAADQDDTATKPS